MTLRGVSAWWIVCASAVLLLLGTDRSAASAADGACGRPLSNGESPLASDALNVLRSALGSETCAPCVCDIDGSGSITATDALVDLKAAVGQSIELRCPACSSTTTLPTSTTTSPTTSTSLLATTTTTTLSVTTTTLEGAGEPPSLAGITAAHNEVRAGVGVPPLVWSAALAATAQAWADACVDVSAPSGLIDHNPNRSEGHPYYVGENIYGTTGTANAQQAVSLWAAEVEDYDYATNTCSGVCGHYTQVVWATTQEVGCATATCPALTYRNVIVCNYGPGGNTGGRPY